MNAVEINDLTKVLKGRTVLSHITLNLEQGGSYGFTATMVPESPCCSVRSQG